MDLRTKICRGKFSCGLEKPIEEFSKHTASGDGYRASCKECIKAYKKKYREENKEDISSYMKGYREDNKEEIQLQTKNYYENNKKEILEYRKEYKVEYNKKNKKVLRKKQNEYESKRVKNDPVFKMRKYISASIRASLKKNDSSKNNQSILEYLPYFIHELKAHLEKQFEPWMNWDNHGIYKVDEWNDNDPTTWTWQIDHIIPHSTFQYVSMEDPQFQECWALENLRPYSSKQNWLDGIGRTRHLT